MNSLKQKLKEVFLFPYFIHAGVSDAITTVFALNIGMAEINPLVVQLYPENIAFLPGTLIAFAYLRALSAILLFKKKRHIKIALWVTLYFPAGFNIINIILHLLGRPVVTM